MNNTAPVDIVYLWVDGSDAAWRHKRQQARLALNAQQQHQVPVYGDVEGRFRDNDELRYSLRALERFFPQHGHIYIVTDAQVPTWLRPQEGLTIVDHRALIPARALPTFDSSNIESYIHRIPGLSERYIYFNDDVFFGAPVALTHWFWERGIYTCWSDERAVRPGSLCRDADTLENACRASMGWLDAHPGRISDPHYRHTCRTFAHGPRPMLRSLMWQLEDLAPALFAGVRSTVFRNWERPTIVSDFVMRWALANGLARNRSYAHAHVATGESGPGSGMQRVISGFGDLHFFCINDTLDNAPADDPRLVQVQTALQGLFGQASRHERSSATPGAGRLHHAAPDARLGGAHRAPEHGCTSKWQHQIEADNSLK